jgi:RNA polymerase sigma-70 factor, ECF subfamily
MLEVDVFQSHRRQLFAVAYRMLGSASDAEDVVQDAWLRYAAARPSDLRSPQAYLTTIVTRL